MSVHVGELRTEVVAEPEGGAPATDAEAGTEAEWASLERFRARWARCLKDDARTRAEGFDD